MEDKVLKYIAASALIGTCVFGMVMIAAVIGTYQEGFGGFLNWTAFGPIVSAIAAIIALFIAEIGWRKSAKGRTDDRMHEHFQKDREILRIATSRAKTLFREFESPKNAAQTSLHNYHSITETQYKLVLERPKGTKEPGQNVRMEFFGKVVEEAQAIIKNLPHDPTKFRDVDRLYQFCNELGDTAVEVNVSLSQLVKITARIKAKGINGLEASYKRGPDDICPIIFSFISELTSFLLSLERFRKMQHNTDYRQSESEAIMEELKTFTEHLIPVQLNTSLPITNSIAYIEMLSALQEYYETKIQEYA